MSVQEQVEGYVEKRPYIQEALADEIVNYSALARKIEGEVDGGFEAVKVSLRRYSEKVKDYREKRTKNISKILQGTSIELKSSVKVAMTDRDIECDIKARTSHGYTCVLNSSRETEEKTTEDQVLITLNSPKNLEGTPGVIAYILSILAGRDINVTELISCREDTHIVIDEKDATDAFKLLNEKLHH